ncbi:PREDICTED: proline-rich receptor-like protein kinase PERK2 [Camelina sativa]|uniref:non-specific serine/threonine protein kinase n=1 Tax=Camelina sativa TaxID=90675 RepID=A0ABM0ZBT2_CAMSA|nr:PREDICTED: proline-rich receptor-like protein kinase PERK2 [Camelina sativa]
MSSAPSPGSTPSTPPQLPPVPFPVTFPPILQPPVVPPIIQPPVVPPITPPPVVPSPPPPTPIPSPPSPLPPAPTTPSPPLTPSPLPPSPPLTPSPLPPSPTIPSPPLTPSPPPPSPTIPSSPPFTPSSPPPPSPLRPSSPPPPSPSTPSTPPRSFPSPPPPSTTPTPPQSGTLNPPLPANPSGGGSSPPPSSPSVGLSSGLVVGIAIGGVAMLVVVLALIFFIFKKKRRRDEETPPAHLAGGPYRGHQHQNASFPPPMPPSAPPRRPHFMSSSSSGGYDSNYSDQSVLPPQSPGLPLGIYQGTFNYEELSRATNGFSEANLLGQGGFGYVFKGMLRNGKEVAVKQLKEGSAQGEREFQAEVGIISRVHHRHLVALVGYCIADAQRLLVYEFVPNNTLEFHLHGKGRPPMEWSSRLKIAIGSAKGLSYLHENCNPKIIHRDIKASNILIDFKFEAKVADFGLAKIASDTNTHVSTRVMGTFGYLAPEYASSGKLTEKSDVFSFGVVLLELITGRRPIDANNVHADNSLVDWARPLLNQVSEVGNFEAVVDTKLNNEYDREEMARMVACAAACVRSTARRRPRMDQVARVLEGNISPSDLNQGITPGNSNVYGSSGGRTDYDSSQDNEGVNKFRKMGLETQDLYSNPISEYDLYPSWSSTEIQTTREMEMGNAKRPGQGYG